MMLTVQLVAEIIQTVMALKDDHIWINNKKKPITNTKELYVVVGLVDAKPYAVNKYFNGDTETRVVHMREVISIDLFSSDLTAPTRLAELVGALNSQYCVQSQEANGFKLASIPMAVHNTSELEGSAILQRFTVTTAVLRAYDNTDLTEYYETFSH